MEYAEKRDPAIDVGFKFKEFERIAQAPGLPALPTENGFIVIWTTTPWTIPSNQALNVHPEVKYSLVKAERDGQPLLLESGARPGRGQPGALQARWHDDRHLRRRRPGRHQLPPPRCMRLTPSTTVCRRCTWPNAAATESGTGVVHSAPAYGLDDFISCKAHGMKDDDIIKPVMGDGKFASTLPCSAA